MISAQATVWNASTPRPRHFSDFRVSDTQPLVGNFFKYTPFDLPSRRIARPRQGEADEVQCHREMFVLRAHDSAPTCVRGAKPRRLAIGPFGYFRVLRCAAPCACRAATAQIARSRRDPEIAPRNLGLKPSLECTLSCPDARAGRETTPTCIGPFVYFRVLRCAAPWAPCAIRAATPQIFHLGVLYTQHLVRVELF